MRIKFLLGGSAAALGLALAATPASAQQVVCDTNLGLQGTASGAPNSMACGAGAVASGNFSTSIGRVSQASGLYSTAVGDYARGTGTDSSAFGVNSLAAGYSTALGFSAQGTGIASTAVGTA